MRGCLVEAPVIIVPHSLPPNIWDRDTVVRPKPIEALNRPARDQKAHRGQIEAEEPVNCKRIEPVTRDLALHPSESGTALGHLTALMHHPASNRTVASVRARGGLQRRIIMQAR